MITRTRASLDAFAARLIAARQELSPSAHAFAPTIGVQRRQFYRYERGEVIPLADRYFAIAKALNVCPYWLMGLTDINSRWNPPTKDIIIP